MNNESTDIGRFALILHQHSDHQQKNKKQVHFKVLIIQNILLVSSQNSSFYNNSENRSGLFTRKLESQHDKRS